MDSRHDFTLEKVFWGYFGALDQKANSALLPIKPMANERKEFLVCGGIEVFEP